MTIPRTAVVMLSLCALSALWAATAVAEPGSGPRETVDQTFTTTHPNTPTGFNFAGVYHAADDPNGSPPAMRRMVVYPPSGMRLDTSVPERCTASDAELQVLGPAACPAGSHIGFGTIEGLIMEPFAHDFVFDHFTHPVYLLNNTDEQILLIESEGYTVVRGQIRSDGSLVWETPTCFPRVPATSCVDDYVIPLRTVTVIPEYTRPSADGVRTYATTPPTCPKGGTWRTTVVISWVDGSTDNVVTTEPCTKR